MNHSMTRIARALSSVLKGSRREPTRHTAMPSLHIASTAATSLRSIAVNRRLAASRTVSALEAGMALGSSVIAGLFAVVPGVGDGQPASYQGSQAGGDVSRPPVHLTGSDRGRKLFLVGDAQAG